MVTVLVVAQTSALIHSDAEDYHPGGDVCALCVGLATFGAGVVYEPQQFDVVVQRAEPYNYVLVHHLGHRIARPFARGPPQTS